MDIFWFLFGIAWVTAGIGLYYKMKNSENAYIKGFIILFIWSVLGFMILSL